MARRVSPSQLRSMIHQAEQQQKQAINRANQAIRKYNQDRKRAVDNYNREVRAYNSQLRAYRQRIQSQPVAVVHVRYRTSVLHLHDAYARLEESPIVLSPEMEDILVLSQRETSNSMDTMSVLMGQCAESDNDLRTQANPAVVTFLDGLSAELGKRWRGALFALSAENPDAARHFCSSVREVFVQIFDLAAPDNEVVRARPDCQRTPEGKPTRRARLRFILHNKGLTLDGLEEFADQDVDNILELFHLFNDGTHGTAGRFALAELAILKRRAEDGLAFFSTLLN